VGCPDSLLCRRLCRQLAALCPDVSTIADLRAAFASAKKVESLEQHVSNLQAAVERQPSPFIGTVVTALILKAKP